jgi:hypothetical protein
MADDHEEMRCDLPWFEDEPMMLVVKAYVLACDEADAAETGSIDSKGLARGVIDSYRSGVRSLDELVEMALGGR